MNSQHTEALILNQRKRCLVSNENVGGLSNENVGGPQNFGLFLSNEIVAILKYPFPGVIGVPRTAGQKNDANQPTNRGHSPLFGNQRKFNTRQMRRLEIPGKVKNGKEG